VEVFTGILLMFYYRPTVEFAYRDMLDLRDAVSLGIIREIHRWAAHAMVITVMLHMLRVFLTGSYKPPREFNWVIGVMLLVLTLLLSFTGYLLPWDQLSLWAVTVGTNIAGATPLVGANGPGHDLLASGGQPLVTVDSDIRYLLLGSPNVGEETLNRFYVLHCIALPLISIFLMSLHFWRIRKDGGISQPL
jgi:quinol-cytochrome oxidoreductase complex cytochrome b subunit